MSNWLRAGTATLRVIQSGIVALIDRAQEITGLWTFDRGTAAPFAVTNTSAAKVTNLDADKLDGSHAAAFAQVSEDNTFAGDINTFEGDVDIDGDLTVGGDATITGTIQAAAAWIPGVAVSLNAKLYCGFNGNEPYETTYTGSSTGHRGQTATETGGVIYREGKHGKAGQVAEATTNLITNPSLETNATNWSIHGAGSTITRVSTDAHYGIYCAEVYVADVAGAGWEYGYTTSIPVSASTSYAVYFSGMVVGEASHQILVRINWSTGAYSDMNVTLTNEWQRLGGVVTSPSGATWAKIYVYRAVAGTHTYRIDALQFEAKAYATPYCDGSLGTGHSWSGTAHASTSSRTAASLYYTNPLSATAGTAGLWWQPAAAASVMPDAYLFDEGGLACWFDTAGNTLKFTDGTNTVTTAAQTFAADDWLHVVCVWSSAGLVLYINGVSAASGGTYTAPTLGASLYVGSDTAGANQCNGLVDDLVILTRALSADEIRAIYESQCQLICS